MSTTKLGNGTEIINPPKSSTSNLISQLTFLKQQGDELAVGDTQVGGKMKKYKIKQLGGRNKKFIVKGRNMEEAASLGFLKMTGKGNVFSVNGHIYYGRRHKKGKKYYNQIEEF